MAFSLALTVVFNFAAVASAKVSFTKPISTSNIEPTDIDRTDFEGVMLIDMTGDAVLYSTGSADAKVPACSSIVTMMSAYLMAINIPHDTVITCPPDIEGEGIGLKAGVKLTMRDLLAAVIYERAEDASYVLNTYFDENVVADEAERLVLMNKTAEELGMKSTYYANTTGEYDPASCTSLKDLVTLTEALYLQPVVSEMLVENSYTIKSVDGAFSETVRTSSPVEISNGLVFVLGSGKSDAGSAISVVAVKEKRAVAFVLSSDTNKLRYSETAEKLFNFAYDEFSIVDFTPLASSLLEKAEAVVSDITVTGFKLSNSDGVKMNEAVASSLAGTILNNESAFSLKADSSQLDGETVNATFKLYYLNSTEVASFEATAQAPEELIALYATPTPLSTSTGYEGVHTTQSATFTPAPVDEEEDSGFIWIVYIVIAIILSAGIIVAAETIKKKMMQ